MFNQQRRPQSFFFKNTCIYWKIVCSLMHLYIRTYVRTPNWRLYRASRKRDQSIQTVAGFVLSLRAGSSGSTLFSSMCIYIDECTSPYYVACFRIYGLRDKTHVGCLQSWRCHYVTSEYIVHQSN